MGEKKRKKRKAKAARARESGAALFVDGDSAKVERPLLGVDVVLLSVHDGALWTHLHRRDAPPEKGHWALPGGLVALDESLDDAAARVVAESTGLETVFLEQLSTLVASGRDPRARVVSVAYLALVDWPRLGAARRRGEGEARLAVLDTPPGGEAGGPVGLLLDGKRLTTAFDHADLVAMAVTRLRREIGDSRVGAHLLPPTFSLLELQRVHETVLGRSVNKDSFRRRMLASGRLERTGESQHQVLHRPAELYRFAPRSI